MTKIGVEKLLRKIKSLLDAKARSIEVKNLESKVMEHAAVNRTSLGCRGKNLLKNRHNAGNVVTTKGITWTTHEDGSITATGTADAGNSDYYVIGGWDTDTVYPSDGYIVSCEGLNTSCYLRVRAHINGTAGTAVTARSEGDNHFNSDVIGVMISITGGVTVNNQTFKPMLRYADITDDSYEPYVPDLQTQINNIYAYKAIIPEYADLNNYSDCGSYVSTNADVSQTLFNVPYRTGGFRLEVSTITPNGARIQKLFPNSSTLGTIYYRNYTGGAWSNWFVLKGEVTETLNPTTQAETYDPST